MRKYFSLILLAFALISCRINEPVENEDIDENPVPHSPQVTYNEIGGLVLSWECKSPTLSVIISELPAAAGKAPLVFHPDASRRQISVPGLTIGSSYNWQVEVRINSDSTLIGPTWSFTYQPSGQNKEGFLFQELSTQLVLPHVIDAHFQVTDLYGSGITGLSVNEFNIFENGEPVSVSESKSLFNKHPIEKFESRIIVLLDVSTSIQNAAIDSIKNSAIDFVNGLSAELSTGNTKIAVYKFSTALEIVADYSSSGTDITRSINSVSGQWSTTNLYGAVIDATELMVDKVTVDEVIKHTLIVFTDGTDTQGSRQQHEALSAVSGKMVFTVGLGNEIDEEVLKAIGVAGYYRILGSTEPLLNGIQEVQAGINNFVNSFYRLRYRTPKRGHVDHELNINLKVNPFAGLNSNIVFNYNSAEFFDVDAGLYINAGQANPEGIDSLFLLPNQEKTITAHAFLLDNDPDFDWTTPVAHPGKAFVKEDPEDNAKAIIQAGPIPWVTRFFLKDKNNSSYAKTLYIVIR